MSEDTSETACPARSDKQHCRHWYDGDACCACDDPPMTNEARAAQGMPVVPAPSEREPEWEYRAVWYSHYIEMEERSHPISEDGARGIARDRNGRVERRVKAEWQRVDDEAPT